MEISEEELRRIQEKIDKLKNSKFKQQMLPAWRPVPSFGSTMIIFGVFGIIFLTLGIVLYIMSEEIQGITKEYQDAANCKDIAKPCECETFDKCDDCTCEITIDIEEDITAPVYVYYQLDNFYQNHRRYVKSRSNAQLMGEWQDVGDLDDCDPIKKNSDLKDNQQVSVAERLGKSGAKALDPNEAAFPCGLVAKSFFTDKFTEFKDAAGNVFPIDETGIAWESDKEYKFKNLDSDWENRQWLDVKDEHFIVWMRTAGLPNFRKLYGKIDQDLPKGEYQLTIQNTYEVDSFDGSKYFVLSTTNVFGGTNYFLAICYIVVGALCISFGIVFFIAYMGKRNAGPNQAGAQ